MDAREQAALDALNGLGIAYERFEHIAAMTMQDCEQIDREISAGHCKNLFLTNRQGTEFYLLLMSGDKQFSTKEISGQLGVSRLSFANERQLEDALGLKPGAVTPLGLIFDGKKAVKVLLDKDLLSCGTVCVHPCVNTASVALKFADLMRFIKSRGNELIYVDIAGKMPQNINQNN